MWRRIMQTAPLWTMLPLRLALGAIFIAHGAQKVFGIWGGRGLSTFIGGDAPLGLRPSWLWLGAAAFAELVGGALILTGFLTRVGAALIAPVMIVAMFGVHWGSFFMQERGMEYTLALLGMSLALLIAGGGRLSVDEHFTRGGGRRR